MFILYGTAESSIDVTDICMQKLVFGSIISIPYNDQVRSAIFTDPHPGVPKIIIVVKSDGIQTAYNDVYIVNIDILSENVTTLGYLEAFAYST